MVAGRFKCPTCPKRLYWCRYCKVRHCGVCSPHPSRARKYLAKNVFIRKRNGQCLIMSARRYAHLRGASKGGQVAATRPNPGRFTPERGREVALKAWATRWRALRAPNDSRPAIRIGRPRKNRPAVDKAAVRAQHDNRETRGVWYCSEYARWYSRIDGQSHRPISERAALQRLGLLPTYTKNWVPHEEPIVKTVVGRLPALKRGRGRKS